MKNKINQGDIFIICSLDSVGSEQSYVDGRPALIVQNDMGNEYSKTTIVVPLTKQNKKNIPTHYLLKKKDYNFLGYDSLVLCEQIRVVDKNARYIERKLGTISKEDLDNIIKVINNNFNQTTNGEE